MKTAKFSGWLLAAVGGAASAGEIASSHDAPGGLLLTDRLGRPLAVSTNHAHPWLHPLARFSSDRQLPPAAKGAVQSEPVRRRIAGSKSTAETLDWFPATPPVLAPYLANLDEYGNTAAQPGALFSTDPLTRAAQAGKYWLSGLGFRETLYQSLTAVWLADPAAGSSSLQYYTADFLGKWAVYEVPGGGPAGWLSMEAYAQLGLSPASRTQSPQGNLGTVVNPQANVTGPNGFWLAELAWQQSFSEGQVVVLAGLVDQGNYLDANAYANSSHSQFLNGAFVNSSVLPLPGNNLGVTLQWQPANSWYLLFGTGANNQAPGQSPFPQLGWANWSYVLEFGLTPQKVLGLGPSVYRFQPFVATVAGETQGGFGFNFQQQLGPDSPLGCFGRVGVGGSRVTLDGARAQASAGLVLQAPLKQLGLVTRLTNDLLGLGLVWSRPTATTQTVYHEDEYALEAFYALQLTPTMTLQPDLQVVWNPAFNPSARSAIVAQLQLNLVW